MVGLDDEDRRMGTCTCRGPWRLARNTVYPSRGHWLDLIGVVCPLCGGAREFLFDITLFFDARPGVWGGERGPRTAGSSSHAA